MELFVNLHAFSKLNNKKNYMKYHFHWLILSAYGLKSKKKCFSGKLTSCLLSAFRLWLWQLFSGNGFRFENCIVCFSFFLIRLVPNTCPSHMMYIYICCYVFIMDITNLLVFVLVLMCIFFFDVDVNMHIECTQNKWYVTFPNSIFSCSICV